MINLDKERLKFILIIIAIVTLGFVLLNQFMLFIYRNQLALQPCDLCIKLNPEVKDCIYPSRESFPDGKGGWTNPFKENNISINLTG